MLQEGRGAIRVFRTVALEEVQAGARIEAAEAFEGRQSRRSFQGCQVHDDHSTLRPSLLERRPRVLPGVPRRLRENGRGSLAPLGVPQRLGRALTNPIRSVGRAPRKILYGSLV